MSGYLVDTNVVSEVRKGARAHAGVRAFFRDHGGELYLSVLVVGEIRRGISSIVKRAPERAAVLDAWLAKLVRDFGERILPVDVEVAERWGELTSVRTLPTVDGLLAATALVHGLHFVTRNVRDIKGTGVVCFDPFTRE